MVRLFELDRMESISISSCNNRLTHCSRILFHHDTAHCALSSHGFVFFAFIAPFHPASLLCAVCATVAYLPLLSGVSAASVSSSSSSSSHSDLDHVFQPKPEIYHQFRAPDSRPPAILSLLFTLLTLAPFVGLLLALAASGLRFSPPSNPSELMYAFLFQASIVACLASYALYWFALNIFQALILAATCGLMAAFAGTSALRMLHQRSKVEAKKKE